MRIVASACLVLALLLMVGCGTSPEDKQAIKSAQESITKMQQDMNSKVLQYKPDEMAKKLAEVDAFLKGKFPKEYGVVPDTMKKEPAPAGKTGKEPVGKTEPKKEEPKKTEPKKKEAPKTK